MKRFGFKAKRDPGDREVEHVLPDTASLQTALSGPAGSSELTFSVTNVGDAAQTLCMYRTPLEGFRGNILRVTDATGATADYIGIQVKRGPPRARHFITLDPGQSRGATFALAEVYRLSGVGPFEVTFVGSPEVNGLPDSAPLVVTLAP